MLIDRIIGGFGQGELDARALDRSLRVRGEGHDSLLELLSKLGLVAERDLAEAAAQILALPLVTARDYPSAPLLEDKVSVRFLHESRILPLAEEDDAVVVAMANPLDRYAIDAMRLIVARNILPRVAIPAALAAPIHR